MMGGLSLGPCEQAPRRKHFAPTTPDPGDHPRKPRRAGAPAGRHPEARPRHGTDGGDRAGLHVPDERREGSVFELGLSGMVRSFCTSHECCEVFLVRRKVCARHSVDGGDRACLHVPDERRTSTHCNPSTAISVLNFGCESGLQNALQIFISTLYSTLRR